MTITDFTALHDAIEDLFRKEIKHIRTVDAYRDAPQTDKIQTPAILVGVEEFEQTQKVTGGRLAMTCVFSAYCLLSSQTKRAETEIRNMAATVALKLDGQRFGLGEAVGRPSNISCVPGIFQNDQPGLECWVVSWEQVIHLGTEWQPEGIDADGFWLRGCHEEDHRLADFPEVQP
ncbi:MAG: hypothetical protein ACRC8B_22620 [Aeromonas sobria]|uniref:hypothetical protein n=1 Tax=Aeromonas sobria TaxID=646 RepID=UPI003F2F393E